MAPEKLVLLCKQHINAHEVALYWIKPFIHQNQYILLWLAGTLQCLKQRTFISPATHFFLKKPNPWRCQGLKLRPSVCPADALPLNHIPWCFHRWKQDRVKIINNLVTKVSETYYMQLINVADSSKLSAKIHISLQDATRCILLFWQE